MNFKNLIPEGVLNPAPNLHETTQEDLDRMKEEIENSFNPETLKEKEELPKFKNKIEFMQAKAMTRKIMNSQKPKKKKKRKK